MSSSNNKEVISVASPHTIKKFDLIEKYVEAWSQKLLNTPGCNQLMFIDCMSNSGEYRDKNGNTIYGTPYRVAQILRETAGQYPLKHVKLIFNDLDEDKIEHLRSILPKEKSNYKINLYHKDANELLRKLGGRLDSLNKTHLLLVYDPYDASIDWTAILPFLNTWGEVIINHQVSDPVRSMSVVKKQEKREKYEETYQATIEELIPFGSDRKAYEERIETIIRTLRSNKYRSYYVASFPFFNQRNSVVYDLIHCTGHIEGFKLFKKTAWQTFGNKSSGKNTHGSEYQFTINFSESDVPKTETDEDCYYVKDIVEYLYDTYHDRNDVTREEMWKLLEQHPVFPTDGFKKEILAMLKDFYGIYLKNSVFDFTRR